MQPNPSLLDWLRVKLGHPRNQRILRFGLAGLAAVWGVYSLLFLGKPGVGGFFFLGLAVGLLFWGLSVRGQPTTSPDMPTVVHDSDGRVRAGSIACAVHVVNPSAEINDS